jgi:hypothetical protein
MSVSEWQGPHPFAKSTIVIGAKKPGKEEGKPLLSVDEKSPKQS